MVGAGCSGGGVVAPGVSDPGEDVPGVPFGDCGVEPLVLGAVPGLGLAESAPRCLGLDSCSREK